MNDGRLQKEAMYCKVNTSNQRPGQLKLKEIG